MFSIARRSLAVRSLPRLATRTLSSAPPPGTLSSNDHIRCYKDLSGEALFSMSRNGDVGSCRERLAREIMVVDKLNREDAIEVVRSMANKNAEGLTMSLMPYHIGIGAAVVAAWVSVPAVFSLQFAKAFNEVMVTTDVPAASDLDTMLEVGTWTWNWMEPPLGTISFFLLCLQYARDQKVNIGYKPWTVYWKERQGAKLAAAYPQYHKQIVRDYGQATCFDDDSDDF